MTATDEADDPDKPTIPTNLRLLLVLEEIARRGTAVAATDLSRALGLPKATAHRLIGTLENEGFLLRLPGEPGHLPGPRLVALAGGVLAAIRHDTAVSVLLRSLSERIGETCNVAMRDGDAMVYIHRAETKWPLQISLPIGTRVPMHCSAAGKVWLASLRDADLETLVRSVELERRAPRTLTDPARLLADIRATRTRGWGEDNEEAIEGMVAIAVAIRDRAARTVATLSFHAPVLRMSLQDARGHVPLLERVAREMAGVLFGATGSEEA